MISDGSRNHEEILDIYELSKLIPDKTLPAIVLGHHDIRDIYSSQRKSIVSSFNFLNVKAYLSGFLSDNSIVSLPISIHSYCHLEYVSVAFWYWRFQYMNDISLNLDTH